MNLNVSLFIIMVSNSVCSVAFVMRQDDNDGICNAVGITNPQTKSSCITNAAEHRGRITNAAEHGVVINSGYRSPQLNKKVGGAVNSNHLTGCAVDIRVSGQEQLIIYAAILIEYANETHQDFDELLLERNRHGAIWLHFAVRPKDNRRHVMFLRT